MQNTNKFLCCLLFPLAGFLANAQPWLQSPYLKIKTPSDSSKLMNFYDIQRAFNSYEQAFDKKRKDESGGDEEGEGKFPGYCQFKRWEWHMGPRVYPTGDLSLPASNLKELLRYQEESKTSTLSAGKMAFAGNWVPLGPTGTQMKSDWGGVARVNFLRFDPVNSAVMWTTSPLGGLWKTVDGGLNWTTNTDLLPIIGCSDVAINPVNPQIMYLATGDANGTGSQLTLSSIGILKSTDGGLTWPLISNTMNWQVGWNRGIYKILINPDHPDTVLAATSNGVYRTSNGGLNWVQTQAGSFTDLEFKPGNPQVVYGVAGVAGSGTFFKSIDGGISFVSNATGLPASAAVARLEIGVTPADSNYVYVVAVKPATSDFYGFYRSVDGGVNFSFRSNTPNILLGAAGSQAWYNLSMAVSPLHKDTLLVGATNLWRTLDGGLTWTKIGNETPGLIPFVHPDHHSLAFLPGTDSVYFSGNDGGIWKSSDRGVTWNPINEGLQISQIYKLGTSSLNPYTILTGHQDMATHRLQSNTWALFTPNTGDGMECIYEYDNDSIMYLESYNGRIIKTINTFPLFNVVCTNSGAGVNAVGSWITPIVMHPVFDSILLIGKSQVWRTVNSGASFSQVGNIPATGGNLISLAYAPSNPSFIYAAKVNHFFVSTDGNTFTEKTIGLPVALAQITSIAVSNTHPERVWVTFSGYSAINKVWVSSDTGNTWSNFSTGLPNLPVNCIVYQNNTNNAVYVGTDVGVYYRSDSIASWQSLSNGLPNVDVEELEIAYSINKIRAATNGRSLWESDLPIVTGISLPVELLSFTGYHKQENNYLNWRTASEDRLLQYEIEKSRDAKTFDKIGLAPAKGNGSAEQDYSFTDERVLPGTNYYRLRQVDFDGETEYSRIISIQSPNDGTNYAVYPVPFKNEFTVAVFSRPGMMHRISITDAYGNYVYDKPCSAQKIAIPASDWSSGIYFINLDGRVKKIMKW